MIRLYKHVNNINSVDACYMKRDQGECPTRGLRYMLNKLRANKKQRQIFLTFRAVNSLNRLPSNIVEAPSLKAFESRLDIYGDSTKQ